MIDEQLPPHNSDAEEAVLGSVLIDGECIRLLSLVPSDFFVETNSDIYQAMLNVNLPDQITVAHELVKMGKLESIGGTSYLSHLVSITPTSLHAEDYARIIKECSVNRKIISAAHKIQALAFENGAPSKTLEASYKLLGQVNSNVSHEIVSAQDMARYAADNFIDMSVEESSLKTGLVYVDWLTGGIFPGEYIIFAAETSLGKTTVALQIARHIALSKSVLYVSLEMSKEEVTIKNIASLSGVNADTIARRKLDEDQQARVTNAIGKLADLKLSVVHGRHTTQTVRTIIERMKEGSGIDIGFVDYLHLLRDRKEKTNDRIDYISKELAATRKESNIPIIALSQMNRDQRTRANKEPMLSDLRDSGALEHDPNIIWFLHRKRNWQVSSDEKNIPLFIVAKDRLRGKTGKIKLKWDYVHEEYRAPFELNGRDEN